MAKLPDVENLGERPTPQPARGVTGYDIPPARLLEAPGEALAAAGNMVASIGAHFQEKQDTTKVEDAWNQYKNAALDATTGQNGVLNLKGGDAVNGNILQRTGTVLGTAREGIEATLTNDDQRRRFAERATVTDLQTKHQVLSHLATEQPVYDKTVMMGSESQAQNQLTAAPPNPDVIVEAQNIKAVLDPLLMQADTFLDSQGVTDKNARDKYKNDVKDSLWSTRITALTYSQPTIADALLRAGSQQISNGKLRLQLQDLTMTAATAVNGTLIAQKALDNVRSKMQSAEPSGRATPEGGPATGSLESVKLALQSAEGSGPEATSIQGARGRMQITEKTFNDYKKPGESFDVEADRVAAANRKVEADYAFYGGDVRKVAAAYIGGRGAIDDQGNIRNVKDALGTTATAYSNKVVSLVTGAPRAPNTSGLPNAVDVAAQLPLVRAETEKLVNEKYGTDPTNPDRARALSRALSTVDAKLGEDVKQLNGIQHQALGQLYNVVAGVNPVPGEATPGATQTGRGVSVAGNQPVADFAVIQSNPTLMRQYMLLNYDQQRVIDGAIQKNRTAHDTGDVVLYKKIFDDIQRDPGDPQKIDFNQQITRYPGAERLSVDQTSRLFGFAKTYESAGGRSAQQTWKAGVNKAELYFKTTPMFTSQTDRQIAAGMQWNEDVGKKIDEYVKAGKDTRSLFMIDTPDSMVDPRPGKILSTYVNSTPAQGVATGAAAVRAGTQQPLAQQPAAAPIAQPANIDSREKLDAWFQTLPATQTTFTGADGVVRKIPARAASAAPAAAGAPQPAAPAAAGMLEPGNINLNARPVVKNGEGYSTVYSMSFNEGGKEVLIPKVAADGSGILSDKAAIEQYRSTGQFLGKFATPEAATTYAKALHEDQAKLYAPTMNEQGKIVQPTPPVPAAAAPVSADDFTLTEKPTTVAGNIAAIRTAREHALALRKAGAVGPAYDVMGPATSVARGVMAARAAGQAAIGGAAAAAGGAIAQAIPTEMEAVYNGFNAIKASRKVSAADADILEQSLKYGQLTPADQKLAQGLLDRINRKK